MMNFCFNLQQSPFALRINFCPVVVFSLRLLQILELIFKGISGGRYLAVKYLYLYICIGSSNVF